MKAPKAPQVKDRVIALLQEARKAPSSRSDLQKMADQKDRMHFKATYLDPLVKAGGSRKPSDKPTAEHNGIA